MKKKIVLIRNAHPFDFGGAERFPTFLASELLLHGFDPVVISRSTSLRKFAHESNIKTIRGWWWRQQNWSGIRALLFPIYVLWQIILYLYYLILFIRLQPHIVHIQSKDDFIAGTFAAKTLRRNVVWTDHADLKHVWKNLKVWYKNPVGKFVRIAANMADNISVVSKSEKKLVLGCINYEVAISKKIHVIYNGAFDQYTPTEKNKTFTYVSTGRLVTDKGIRELIEAFTKIQQEFPDTQLQLIGDGPERKKFESLAKSTRNIYFLGHKKNPLTYLASAQVFALPTYHEGFSIALVEACMEELAIIATNVGGNPEIIEDKKSGLLIPAKSVDELYEAMKLLYRDKVLRETLSQNARKKYITSYDFKNIIKNDFLPLYEGKL